MSISKKYELCYYDMTRFAEKLPIDHFQIIISYQVTRPPLFQTPNAIVLGVEKDVMLENNEF